MTSNQENEQERRHGSIKKEPERFIPLQALLDRQSKERIRLMIKWHTTDYLDALKKEMEESNGLH